MPTSTPAPSRPRPNPADPTIDPAAGKPSPPNPSPNDDGKINSDDKDVGEDEGADKGEK